MTKQALQSGNWSGVPNTFIDDWMDDLSNVAVRLYIMLGRMADERGVCWPSVPTLSIRLKRSRRAVFAGLKELVTASMLVRTSRRGRGHSNEYRVLDPPARPQKVQPSAPFDGEKGAAGCIQKVQPAALKGAAGCTHNKTQEKDPTAAVPASPSAAAAGGGGKEQNGNGGHDETTGNGQAAAENGNDQATTDPAVAARRQALAIAGIGNPTRTELANRSLTPDQIFDAKARQPNVRLLVLDLRGLADQAEALAEDRAEAEAKRKAEETVRAPRRAAYMAIKAEFEPQSDADRLWHVRHEPRGPRLVYHRAEFDFAATHPLCIGWSPDRYDAACVAISEALKAHPDEVSLLYRAKAETTDTPDLRIAKEVG